MQISSHRHGSWNASGKELETVWTCRGKGIVRNVTSARDTYEGSWSLEWTMWITIYTVFYHNDPPHWTTKWKVVVFTAITNWPRTLTCDIGIHFQVLFFQCWRPVLMLKVDNNALQEYADVHFILEMLMVMVRQLQITRSNSESTHVSRTLQSHQDICIVALLR
jgi:hypothetical protein